MTSPVDTTVKHFTSVMPGAPVLSGTVGAMIAVLDACLVNGFDIKVATSLVVASGVATLSFAGTHSATVDSVVLVEGVTGAMTALNGEQKVTAIGVGTVSFATAAADGTAAGTISFKMAPAGWEKVFSGTNLAVYRSLDPQSTKMHLRVDDTGTTSCRIRGFETMTDVNTGTGPFPTDAQISGGGYWSKSGLASTAATQWVLVSDARKFIMHNANYYSNNIAHSGGVTRGFGDDIAYRPGGDPYACSLSYSTTSTPTSQFDGALDYNTALQQAMPRDYTGLGACTLHLAIPVMGSQGQASGMDALLGAFPGAIDSGLRLSKKLLSTAVSAVPPRAELPGLYHVPHSLVVNSFVTRSTIPGTGRLAGRTMMALNPATSLNTPIASGNAGVSFVDVTGPWR